MRYSEKYFHFDIVKFTKRDYPMKNKKSMRLDRQTRSEEVYKRLKAIDIMSGRKRSAHTKKGGQKQTQ